MNGIARGLRRRMNMGNVEIHQFTEGKTFTKNDTLHCDEDLE
jgi:hypothetical protein